MAKTRTRSCHRVDAFGAPLKIGDRVVIQRGWFKFPLEIPWNGKTGTPGTIVKWSGCGVAEVRANVPSYGRGATFDVGTSNLAKRRR